MARIYGSRRRASSLFMLDFQNAMAARVGLVERKPMPQGTARNSEPTKFYVRRAPRVWIIDLGRASERLLVLLGALQSPTTADARTLQVCTESGKIARLSEIQPDLVLSTVNCRLLSIEELSELQKAEAYKLLREEQSDHGSIAKLAIPDGTPAGVRVRKKHRFWVALTNASPGVFLVLGPASCNPKNLPIEHVYVCDPDGERVLLTELLAPGAQRVRFALAKSNELSNAQRAFLKERGTFKEIA